MSIRALTQRRSATRQRRLLLTLSVFVSGAVVTLVALPSASSATSTILLGTSDSFAVLAGAGITNTGATSITGDVGTFPTTTMTGFDSVTLVGVNHGGDAVTQGAKDDLTTAYNQAAASGPTTAVATELGGRTLTPGVYGNDTLEITGTLTLDTLGDPHAVFVFQAATTLTTATDSKVVILGGGEACNVFWQVGSSATLGIRAHLVGSVLAHTSITATTNATVLGRLLAREGAVTLDHNTLTRATCTALTATTEAAAPTATDGLSDSTSTAGGAVDATSTGSVVTGEGGVGSVPLRTATGTARTPEGPTTGSGAPELPETGIDPGVLTVVGVVVLGIGVGARSLARRRCAPFEV